MPMQSLLNIYAISMIIFGHLDIHIMHMYECLRVYECPCSIYICNIYTISMQYPHALPRKYAIELEPREASRRRASIRCGWRAAAERQAIPEYERTDRYQRDGSKKRTQHTLPLPVVRKRKNKHSIPTVTRASRAPENQT